MLRRLVARAVVGVAMMAGMPAFGQYTLITDFEGSWTYDVGSEDCHVMFLDPDNASTTLEHLAEGQPNGSYVVSENSSLGPYLETSSGTQAVLTTWIWDNPANHHAWIRLQTTKAVDIPNPGIHLGGKVRFYFGGTAYAGSFGNEVAGAHVNLAIGVRETGTGTPLGQDAGISGDVEWVGADKLIEILAGTNGFCDTIADPESDDVQVIPFGSPAPEDGVCVAVGTNGVMNTEADGDDGLFTTPIGLISVPLDRTMRQYEFDLPALEAAGYVFGFTGDGHLEAEPNNRGSLEHLAIVNDPSNAALNADIMLLWIDDVEFYSSVPNPPVIVTKPVPPRPMDFDGVDLSFVEPGADSVELFVRGNGGDPDYLLGSISNPAASMVTLPTNIPLPPGSLIYARQTVGGVLSDNSDLVLVESPGNAPLRVTMGLRETDAYDHDLSCGDDGTGYDPVHTSNIEWIGATGSVDGNWGTPIGGKRIVPSPDWQEITFDPCVDPVAGLSGNGEIFINTTGVTHTNSVWEGLYFRIDEFSPATGPYTVYIDDMAVINGGGEGIDCPIDDFESYEIAEYIVEAKTAGTPGVGTAATVAAGDDVQIVAPGSETFMGQKIVGPGPNGVLDTEPATDEEVSAMHARVTTPGGAGTNVGIAEEPRISAITDEESYSGSQSLKLNWAFVNVINMSNHLRATTNGSTADNPPETFLNPDPVIPVSLDGTFCDGVGDIYFSVKLKIEPNPILGDSDGDLDIDLADYAAFQECYTMATLSPECDEKFDYYNDDVLDADDFLMLQLSMAGPK